jgi:hypothetical protein
LAVLSYVGCLALIVLWVRSHRECITWGCEEFWVGSSHGLLGLSNPDVPVSDSMREYRRVHQGFTGIDFRNARLKFGFWFNPDAEKSGPPSMIVPYWFPTCLTAVIALLSWPYWSRQFSIKSLLIATTIISVSLAVVLWLVRIFPAPPPMWIY